MARRIFLLVLIISWLTANLLLSAEPQLPKAPLPKAQPSQPQFYPFGNLGGDDKFGKSSQAFGVSGDGQCVVGESLVLAAMGITTGTEAFLWTKEHPKTKIDTLSTKNAYSSAKAISSKQRVAVGESQTEDGMRAFRWTEATGIQSLGVLSGHDESVAWSVSDDGEIIVGESSSLSEELAFRWTKGKMVALDDLPGGKMESTALAISLDGTTIVGHSNSENGTEACAWTATGVQGFVVQGLGSLGGERFASRALAVSADGKVIVGGSLSERGREAFRWTQETGMVPLGDLPEGEFQSRASGVSTDGNTIVGQATGVNGAEAFIWTPENKMQSLAQLLQQRGLAKGWRLQEACGISRDGTVIIGNGLNPNEEVAGWIVKLR